MAPTMINEHVFIGVYCLWFSLSRLPEGVREGPVESSKNFNETQIFMDSIIVFALSARWVGAHDSRLDHDHVAVRWLPGHLPLLTVALWSSIELQQ